MMGLLIFFNGFLITGKADWNKAGGVIAGMKDIMESRYDIFKSDKMWTIIEKSIDKLVKNDDIVEKTDRDHIVGYIVENIIKGIPN